MLLDEHQSKHLFAEAGIPVPPGVLLRPTDLEGFTPPWPGPWYVKGQALAGGRAGPAWCCAWTPLRRSAPRPAPP